MRILHFCIPTKWVLVQELIGVIHFFSRALSKNNHHIGKRYIEVFESKAGEMEWVCKRMGQPQDKGDESVVRLRGLPYEISKEEIVQFFTGKIKFFIFHNSKWCLFKSDVESKRPTVVLKNALNLECL